MDLPEFPQGGEIARGFGTGGIPSEQWRSNPQTPGADFVTQTLRPEDTPAMQAALGAEVDTLMGGPGQPPPPAQHATAPAQPDTQRPSSVPGAPDTTRPQVPSGSLEERMARVLQKYNANPEEIAKALVHSNQTMTQATQDRSMLAGAVDDLRNRFSRLEQILSNPQPHPGNGGGSVTPGEALPQVDGDSFLRDPIGTLMPHLERKMDEVVKSNILAYSAAQRQVEQQGSEERNFADLRAKNAEKEKVLSPIMDMIFNERPAYFSKLPKDEAYEALLSQAGDRLESMRAKAFFEDLKKEFGGNTPGSMPGQTGGGLPSPGAPMNRPGPAAQPSNWSETNSFKQLWKAPSGSVEETGTVMDILKERGFGEDIKL